MGFFETIPSQERSPAGRDWGRRLDSSSIPQQNGTTLGLVPVAVNLFLNDFFGPYE